MKRYITPDYSVLFIRQDVIATSGPYTIYNAMNEAGDEQFAPTREMDWPTRKVQTTAFRRKKWPAQEKIHVFLAYIKKKQ